MLYQGIYNVNYNYNHLSILLYGIQTHHTSSVCQYVRESDAFRDAIIRVTRSSRIVILNLNFAAKGRHSLLWPEATTIERLQRPICGRKPPHFIVTKGHNIWIVTIPGQSGHPSHNITSGYLQQAQGKLIRILLTDILCSFKCNGSITSLLYKSQTSFNLPKSHLKCFIMLSQQLNYQIK